ncbi:MAG: chalcone isomerase family protein [Verrucomicrobium sp.]|nr:chalcone isomerase family protein [Verrucomicrobium sp.]
MQLPMLRRFLGLMALLASLCTGSGLRAELVSPQSLTEDGTTFQRIGTKTFRWMSILKVYDASLHLGAGESPERVFADIPMRLHLVYHRGFTAAEIVKGGDTLLARNVDAATLTSLRDRLERLNATYRDVKPGDSYTLTYVPGAGTTLRLNGSALITVPGHDFAAAYFRIWLGDKPINDSLRDALLGR